MRRTSIAAPGFFYDGDPEVLRSGMARLGEEEWLPVLEGRPTVTVYPDSDKVGVWTGDPKSDPIAPRDSAVECFDGET